MVRGAPFPDGEIPLHRLALIAERTQAVVQRLARSLTDRGTRGRTPQFIEAAAELRLIAIRAGSTVLEIAGPSFQAELDLGEVPAGVGTQALATLIGGVEAAAAQSALPDAFDELSREAFVEWFRAFEDAEEVGVRGTVGGTSFETNMVPRGAGVYLGSAAILKERTVDAARSVEGILYAVNLHTGLFRLQDDAGLSITVSSSLSPDEAAPLLGKRVRASGSARRDATGHLSIDAVALVSSEGIPGLDASKFFARTDLDSLVANVTPLESVGSLALEDVTEDEAEAFRSALERPA
ncbi:MAG: hypothetical protein HY775_08905 [Acidobacteria bacterium]|nr:hypothetical protein [Acidobacteriota bacterium]